MQELTRRGDLVGRVSKVGFSSLSRASQLIRGIVIRMYYQEHEPARFHADYQGQQATFLLSGEVLAGEIRSGTARRLIREWAAEHRGDLEANWARMKAGEALERIRPLE